MTGIWKKIGKSFFLISVFWTFCNREAEPPFENVTETPVPTQEGWNSKITVTKAGKLQAVVYYGHMSKYEDKTVVFFDEGVEVDFFDEEGRHSSHLRSLRGEYHENTEDVIGLGNVIVESDSGITLHTESLRLDNKQGKIFSDTTVIITTSDKDTLYGTGFESRTDLTHWKISKPWGISEKKLDIEKLESSFSKSEKKDTLKGNSQIQ